MRVVVVAHKVAYCGNSRCNWMRIASEMNLIMSSLRVVEFIVGVTMARFQSSAARCTGIARSFESRPYIVLAYSTLGMMHSIPL